MRGGCPSCHSLTSCLRAPGCLSRRLSGRRETGELATLRCRHHLLEPTSRPGQALPPLRPPPAPAGKQVGEDQGAPAGVRGSRQGGLLPGTSCDSESRGCAGGSSRPPDALGTTGGAGEVRGADTRAAQAAFWREGQGTPEQGLAWRSVGRVLGLRVCLDFWKLLRGCGEHCSQTPRLGPKDAPAVGVPLGVDQALDLAKPCLAVSRPPCGLGLLQVV